MRVLILSLGLFIISQTIPVPSVALDNPAEVSNKTAPAQIVQPAPVRYVPSVNVLRQTPGETGALIYVQAHTAPGDGGGGYFYWVSGKAPQTYADNNATTIVPRGGDGSAAWLREFEENGVNVRWFGARGDGLQDDGPAINAAVDYLRARTIGGGARGENSIDVRLLIPPGRYRIATSINMTGIRQGRVWFVDARGAVLLGNTPGRAVVDLLGSRACSWLGGHIVGDEKNRPLVGVQIGRADGKVADNHSFIDLGVTGYFSRASLYNYASEGSYFAHVHLANNDPSPSSYALIQDGTADDFAPVSDYVNVTGTGPASFNENVFVRADLRKPFGGPTAYLSRTARHSFIGAYLVSVNDANVVIKSDGFGHKQLHLDLHGETSADTGNNRGLQNIVRFEGNAVQRISGLFFRESNSHALDSCFKAGPGVRSVIIKDADIQIGGFRVKKAPPLVFSAPSLFRIDGTLSVHDNDGSPAKGLDIAEMKGRLRVNDREKVAMPNSGSYTIIDEKSQKQ